MKNANIFTGYNSVFATRLRELMIKNDTKQKELAKITKITRQAISQYADGSVQPNIEKLYKISEYFSVSADYLLGRAECKDPANEEIHKKTGLSPIAIEKLIEFNSVSGGLKGIRRQLPKLISTITPCLGGLELLDYSMLQHAKNKMIDSYNHIDKEELERIENPEYVMLPLDEAIRYYSSQIAKRIEGILSENEMWESVINKEASNDGSEN